MEKKERILLWDNAKGILIFLVVFAHFFYDRSDLPIAALLTTVIYSFHMPAFAFISGFFTREKTDYRKLLTAYVIFNGILLFYNFRQTGNLSLLSPCYMCWYLLALCAWRLLTPPLSKYRYSLPILCAVALLCGFVSEINNVLAISRILAFWPFFMCGYLLRSTDIKKVRKKYTLSRGLVLLLLFLATILTCSRFTTITLNELVMLPYSSPKRLLVRAAIFACATLATLALVLVLPDREIPFLSSWGKHSMSIFLLHRIFILIIVKVLPSDLGSLPLLSISLLLSIVLCILFGNDRVGSILTRLLMPTQKNEIMLRNLTVSVIACALAILIVLPAATPYLTSKSGNDAPASSDVDPIYRVMSSSKQTQFNDAFKIVFSGDLLLLEDQVRRAYDETSGTYDFRECFEYTCDEISSADLAIGVLEGPLPGDPSLFSTSNFADGKELYLGFPDEWAMAIREAGFDLLTTANNHLLDRGTDPALRTLDVLDGIGMDHTGSYRSAADKKSRHIHLIEQDGLRIAVLSYTYGTNFYETEDLLTGPMSYISSFLVGPEDAMYEQVRSSVEADFSEAKALSPDLIVVLPHMGTQFLDAPDEFQTTWHDNFIEFGADIILGDHTHSVQPAFLEEANGKTIFTAYCPGNYANIFREFNGDASALIEVYIDRDSKKPIGGGIIPMWTSAALDGNYRPIPIYDILTDPELASSFTTKDYERIVEVHDHITSVMLGTVLPIDMIEPVYYFDQEGFLRTKEAPLDLTEELSDSAFLKEVNSCSSVCFLGDSITYGTKNGGIPWYEPVLPYITGTVSSFSYGGWTTLNLLNNIKDIPSADLYVVAIGTNDLRYDSAELGAVTAEDYIRNIGDLAAGILSRNRDAHFIFIAPWISTDGDKASLLPIAEVNSRREAYSEVLKSFCQSKGCTYIDPNPYIEEKLLTKPQSYYLLDWIHPNRQHGVAMYCEAVLLSSSER
ncbi:MAG: CapA family protein [Clostridiales bacterium]|nr:CapA family protein [Clostridiales bacterium]